MEGPRGTPKEGLRNLEMIKRCPKIELWGIGGTGRGDPRKLWRDLKVERNWRI